MFCDYNSLVNRLIAQMLQSTEWPRFEIGRTTALLEGKNQLSFFPEGQIKVIIIPDKLESTEMTSLLQVGAPQIWAKN